MDAAPALTDRSETIGRLDGLQRALVGLEIVLAVSAYGGSIGLMTGSMSTGSYARRLPFGSVVLGGAALGLLVAVPATVAAVLTLRRRPGAAVSHLVVGAMLMGWILVQVAFIGLVSGLQPVMFCWGAAIMALGWLDRRRAPTSR